VIVPSGVEDNIGTNTRRIGDETVAHDIASIN
jgi:hypothetical protein